MIIRGSKAQKKRKIESNFKGNVITNRSLEKNIIKKEGNGYRLLDGVVDPHKEHIGIQYGGNGEVVAHIAPGSGKTFTVEFLVDSESFTNEKGSILEKVQQEITFYLLEHGPRSVFGDPWKYAKYHCGTAANIYSSVHWGWYPEKTVSEEEKQQHAMNEKKAYICPKCESKFIVSGTVPFTCPKCKKAELIPYRETVSIDEDPYDRYETQTVLLKKIFANKKKFKQTPQRQTRLFQK